MPLLHGSYFADNLILVCEHNAEGALGLVVNKTTQTHLDELLTELELAAPTQIDATDIIVYEGGPVSPERGFILHTGKHTTVNSLKICPGLYLAGARDVLDCVVSQAQENEFLFLLGYAGWEADQLEAEIQANSWLTCAARADVIFERRASQRMQAAVDQLGFDYRLINAEAGHA